MCVSVLLTMTTAAPSAVNSIIAISAMMSAAPRSSASRARKRFMFSITV
jgi:hypothetical protein